jgi:hypothetical protein
LDKIATETLRFVLLGEASFDEDNAAERDKYVQFLNVYLAIDAAQCLTPEQVYDINSVGQEQPAHLVTCPWCKNMMAAAQPTNEEFEEICRKANSAAKTQCRHEIAAG